MYLLVHWLIVTNPVLDCNAHPCNCIRKRWRHRWSFRFQTSCRQEAATICPTPCDIHLWPFDLESGVRVTCDVGYFCANFSLPRPLWSRLRPDVRDRRQTDVRQHHRLILPPSGRDHNDDMMLMITVMMMMMMMILVDRLMVTMIL